MTDANHRDCEGYDVEELEMRKSTRRKVERTESSNWVRHWTAWRSSEMAISEGPRRIDERHPWMKMVVEVERV